MSVHVLVLSDRPDGLSRTQGGLDAQSVGTTGLRATYVVTEGGDHERLRALVERRPNLAVAETAGRGWGEVVAEQVAAADADRVLVVGLGEALAPEALERLQGAASAGADVVVGRRLGGSTWGAAEGRGPVGVVLATRETAQTAARSAGDAATPTEWLAAFHDQLLGGDARVVAHEVTSVSGTSPETGSSAASPEVREASAAWDGDALVLRATTAAGTVDPRLVLRSGSREVVLDTEGPDARGGVQARLRITDAAGDAPLGDGAWRVLLVAGGPGSRGETPLPRVEVVPGLVGGRPVVTTLKGDVLELQVGVVRRRWFTADTAGATITESARGTELLLPLQGPHVATDTEVPGAMWLGGLKIPAVLRPEGKGLVLQAWLSGLAGDYPIQVDFGHVQRVPLGLTLAVDGVGAMRLVPTRRKAAPAAAAAPAAPGSRLARIRSRVPAPVVRALSNVPGAQKVYRRLG